MLREQTLLLVPEFLREVDIIVMRIVESQNLVPEGVDLLGAVLLHLVKRRALVDALAIFEELDGQRLCNIVFDYLSLPCEVGV